MSRAALTITILALSSACSGNVGGLGRRDASLDAAMELDAEGAADRSLRDSRPDGPPPDTLPDTPPVPEDASGPDSGPCVPNCAGVLCGEDDGCGTPCSGAHREAAGSVSDCRAGDCGCGAPGIDNTVCTDSGLCRVHCSCDCLPPQLVPAQDLVGLDHAGACLLVFQRSGDPTVYDSSTGQALCPLDHDPQGPARCTECPPCHRPHPPECGWDAWCTCTDPRWYDDYHNQCCAAGSQYCY